MVPYFRQASFLPSPSPPYFASALLFPNSLAGLPGGEVDVSRSSDYINNAQRSAKHIVETPSTPDIIKTLDLR